MIRRRPLLRAGLTALVLVTGCTPQGPFAPAARRAQAAAPTPLIAAPTPPAWGGQAAPPAAGAPSRTTPVPRPAHKPKPPAKALAAASRAAPGAGMPAAPAALPSAALPSAELPTAASSDTLIGLDPKAATALLGPPAETEEHPPATIWRYRGGGCTLELVFYFDRRSGALRSLRDELRGAAGDPERRKACLRAIAEASHAAGPPSR
jgi:hypothetical protein